MKKIIPLLFILSCKHGAAVDGGTLPTSLTECAKQATHDTAINLIPAVTTALSTGQWEAVLATLVIQWGESAVKCAVYHVVATSTDAAKATPGDDLAQIRVTNGKTWLTQHGVTY